MGSVQDIDREDDVGGHIVGPMRSVGFLTYAGKKQRGEIYAGSEAELKDAAIGLKRSIICDCGSAWRAIFPDDSKWRLEIAQ